MKLTLGGKSKIALILALAILACALLWGFIAPALKLVLGAALVSFLLAPICISLSKKLTAGFAAAVTVAGVILFLALLIYAFLPPIVEQVKQIVGAFPDIKAALMRALDGVNGWLERMGIQKLTMPEMNMEAMGGSFLSIAAGTVNIAGSFASAVSDIALLGVLSFFFLRDRKAIMLRLELLIPHSARPLCVRMATAMARDLKLYLRGQALIALFVGILSSAGLMIAGVRSAMVLGLVVGVFDLIPYFGPVLGSIPAVLYALTDSWQKALFAVIALFAVQQIEGTFISPRILGNVTGLSPAIVLIAIYVGARVLGIAGMLFAVPAVMAIRAAARVFAQRT